MKQTDNQEKQLVQQINNPRKKLTTDEAAKVVSGENGRFRRSVIRTESIIQSIICEGCSMPCTVDVTTAFFDDGTQETSVSTPGCGDCCPNCGCPVSESYHAANNHL